MLKKTYSPNRVRQQMRRKQGGWLMAELALVLAVSSILTALQFSQIINTIDQANAVATAKYLVELQVGLNKYVEDNSTALKNGSAITGFVDPVKPTISELLIAKDLPQGFSLSSPLGLPFKVQLTRDASCPGGASCTITGTAYSGKAYKDVDGTLRNDVLSYAVSEIGPDGGVSTPAAPDKLTSMGGGAVPNPLGNVPGVLGIRIGFGSGTLPSLSQYYLLDGSRPLKGEMNANGNNIKGVDNLTVTNKTSTGSLTVATDVTMTDSAAAGSACSTDTAMKRNANGTGLIICSGGTWQTVGNAITGIADGAGCPTAGQFGTNATGVSFVCNGTFWATLNTTAAAGDPCAPANRVATTIAREQLVCRSGQYVPLANLMATSVEASRQLVTDGTAVAKPACSYGGTPVYSFNLTQTVIDVSVTPPRQAMYISATDNGTTWTVRIRVTDNTGGDYSANPYSVSAVMKLECAY